MYLPELRALVLCFFIFLSGCEIRRVDSVSAYAETLTAQENDLISPEAVAISPASPARSNQNDDNSFLSLLGIQITAPDQEEEYLFSPEELYGLSQLDVRLYSLKNIIANDLVNNNGNHAASCSGTDFMDVLSFQNTIEIANQSYRLTRSQEQQQWQNALKDAETVDIQDFAPTPEIEDPLSLWEKEYLALVDEDFARFRVTGIYPRHFQYIEVTSVDARNAKLLVDATGRVTTNDNIPRIYYAHPVQLTYYFTLGSNEEWKCAHLHATYNPFNINESFWLAYNACDYVKGGIFRGSKRRNQNRCRENVIRKYEKLNVDISNIPHENPNQSISSQEQSIPLK